MPQLKTVSEFTGKWFALIVVAAGALALITPDTFSGGTPAVPWLLSIIMLGMGMTLRLSDFAVVARRPWALLLGVAAQFIAMPLLGLGIANVLGLSAALTAGMVLVGSAPGGTASNVMVYLAKGDTALSVAMTSEVYVVVMAVGAAIFGDEWFSCADPFEVYSDTVSRLSPLARDAASGVLALRSPLDGAVSLPVQRGTVAVLAVLLGSTAFDSIGQIPAWRSLVDESALGSVPTRTLGLIAVICVVGAAFWSAARATGGVSRSRRSALPGLIAHSLIPIVVGYMTAHYLTYFVEKGQQTIISLSDPLGNGANVLGLQDASVSYVLSNHPSVVAGIAVLAVVVGHLVGITLAHDASLRTLPKEHAATGQLAMMVVMVLYTFGGLFLLFGA